MRQIKISWLGFPVIKCDNTVVRIETQKATALLAYLCLSNAPVPRKRLATLFWPKFDRARALANLRRILFSITHSVDPEFFITDHENIGINPNSQVWQDKTEFHALLEKAESHPHADLAACPECTTMLENATSIYRGDFLEGINLPDCPEFDDWMYTQREGFKQALVVTLEKLTQTYSSIYEWNKTIQKARRWIQIDFSNENAQRILIQAYAQAGQKSAALQQFEKFSLYLKNELGQEPQEETIALVERIQKVTPANPDNGKENDDHFFKDNPIKQPLIQTKLFIPHVRSGMIPRQSLSDKLHKAAQSALTLISAPAGYGKTTLLSEWVNSLTKETSLPWIVCWISLDLGDNDPIRFLTYLTAALEKNCPGLGAETKSVIHPSPSFNPSTPLAMLINDLQELQQSILLVFDDYHFINNSAIHDGIIFLLEHLPPNVHVVISTRSDPPFPLARIRGQNLLTEIRANDLRFSSSEIAEFLNRTIHFELSPEQISALENRTEGWIAGLQMAAISMQGRVDIAQFIEAFSGSHRFIMDYLSEEALNRQPIEIQEFLFRTSILDQLSDSLCEYVLTGKEGNKDNPQIIINASLAQNQNLLSQLELSNLFIIPLDNDRIWYRYHHLFADLLRTRLKQASPELISTLHSRASAWYEKNGWIEESITHSLAARDWKKAGHMIALNIPAYLEDGQLATIMKWINALPQEIIFNNPQLCALVAEVYSQGGLIDQIDPLLDKVEEFLIDIKENEKNLKSEEDLNLSQNEITVIGSMVWILRGLKSICTGDPTRALDFTHTALANFPEMEAKERAVLFWVEGWAYRSLGNLDHGLNSLTKATHYAQESGAAMRDTYTDLANVTRVVGNLPQACEIINRSLQTAANRGVQNQGNLSRDESFLCFLYLEQNKLDLAFSHANRAIAYTQWWPSHNIIALAYTGLAQTLLALNEPNSSIEAITMADKVRKNRIMTPFVHSMVDLTFAQIWLNCNEWGLLDKWSADQISLLNTRRETGTLIDEYLEMRLVMLVRVWMNKTIIDKVKSRYEECLHLLIELENNSRSAGRINSLVEILLLKECIHFSQGKKLEAVNGIEECLSLAKIGMYMRVFLNTRETARDLLIAYLEKPKPLHKSYALKILEEFGKIHSATNTHDISMDFLSSREMEVLKLLAEGCSNRQIAERLILSEGTIKFHVHNLLQKMQADSRTQAIAKAREIGLI